MDLVPNVEATAWVSIVVNDAEITPRQSVRVILRNDSGGFGESCFSILDAVTLGPFAAMVLDGRAVFWEAETGPEWLVKLDEFNAAAGQFYTISPPAEVLLEDPEVGTCEPDVVLYSGEVISTLTLQRPDPFTLRLRAFASGTVLIHSESAPLPAVIHRDQLQEVSDYLIEILNDTPRPGA